MDYDLADKLKSAGFPQPDGYERKICNGESDPAKCPFVPTLSELIAACGDGFYALFRHITEPGQWSAERSNGLGYNSSTPEEAVANLWLALNEKKT